MTTVRPIRSATLGTAVLLAACASVGPDYRSPEVATGAAWRQARESGLVDGTPADGAWWKVFGTLKWGLGLAKQARLERGRHARTGTSLRHRPRLGKREAEARLKGLVVLGVRVRSETEPDLMLTFDGVFRQAEENGRHHAKVVDDRGARVDHALPPLSGMEAIELDHAAA